MTGIILASVFLFVTLVRLHKEDDFDLIQSLKERDAQQAEEEAEKLAKRAEAVKKEYLKLEGEARRARIMADEAARLAKHTKNR